MERFSVYEGYMDDLRKKVVRIKNKCQKYGCDFHFAEVGEEFVDCKVGEKANGQPIREVCRFVIVEAEGTAIINDWEFVASVEHTEKGNIFSKALTDVEIPERYRDMIPTCEHCHTDRYRKSAFIVHNTVTDEFKMVGKSCLCDFTNGLSASVAAWFASTRSVFEEMSELPVGGGSWGTRYYDVHETLLYIAETIRHFGYAKTDSADATKTKFQTLMDIENRHTRWMSKDEVSMYECLMEKVGFDHNSNEAQMMVNSALAWVNAQEAKNDYMHNLKTVCSLKYTHCGHFGLLVSLFPTYDRELEREAQVKKEIEAGQKSEWIGDVGDRVEIEVASVKCITSWESSYGYYPTMTFVWRIDDVDGNIFTWKTSTALIPDEPPKMLKGTVKSHTTYKTVKQTELTRCRVA